jgi:excisionase family DNA binding protein
MYPYNRGNSLTPKEASIYLGVAIGTIYSYISRGQLSTNLVGHERRVSIGQLEAFKAARRANGSRNLNLS